MSRAALALGALAAAGIGCSLLVSLDGYSDVPPNADDAGEGGAAGGCDCLPSVPLGWSIVAFAAATSTPCPDGYDHPTDLVVDPSLAAAACSCTCAIGAAPSCANGLASITHANAAGCAGGTADKLPVDGGCGVDNTGLALNSFHAVDKLAPSGGACAPTTTTTLPSRGNAGRTCSAMADAGLCATGTCAHPAAAPFAACIALVGAAECPPGFPHAHAVGSSLADTRGCNADCACGAPSIACGPASFTWYSDSTCTGSIATVTADGTCQSTASAGQIVKSHRYAASVVDAGCAPPQKAPTSDGGASLADPLTVCCR